MTALPDSTSSRISDRPSVSALYSVEAPEDAPALSALERERYVRAVEASLAISRRHQFFLWAQADLIGLLPHMVLVTALRDVKNHRMIADRYSGFPFPDPHFDELCASSWGLLARMTNAWLDSDGQPLVALPGQPGYPAFEPILCGYGCRGAVLHGMLDQGGAPASCFLFLGIEGGAPRRTAHLVSLLTPHLHAALLRVTLNPASESSAALAEPVLTAREIEILRWIRQGKSNTAIGELLSISPLTVKNHVQKILRKLGVQNRAQAVAKAISLKLIPLYGDPVG
jgi:transcriptional regulator EpsA